METINASDAKREFGDLLIKAQHSPVTINKNGKPVAVVVSANEFELLNKLKEEYLQELIKEGIDDLQAGRVIDSQTLLNRLKQRTELKALASQPDEALDTSDISEISDWDSAEKGKFYCKPDEA